MDEPVRWTREQGIARIALNRPQIYNAFDREMIRFFAETLAQLAGDPGVSGVVITGEGKAFCAGADLKWLSVMGEDYGKTLHLLAASYHQAILEIRRMPKPVVAAINGMAAGGGLSLALACDFRVMEVSAVFRLGYPSNGLSIDGGGTFTLPRLVGMARAMEIAAFDRPISSEQALSWGLVSEVARDGQALPRAVEMVREIVQRPLTSFAASKRLITDTFHASFETQLEREREFLASCADHPNGHEGVSAFLGKRRPRYNVQ